MSIRLNCSDPACGYAIDHPNLNQPPATCPRCGSPLTEKAATREATEGGADRNLLFGVLALQMDFVTRDQLVAGMNAWVLEKASPLGQVLVQQKSLGQDRYLLLQALVQAHLKQHADDPQKSLAALSELGSAKKELEKIADPELAQSLGHVAAEKVMDGNETLSLPPARYAGERFRILRPHAKGGLGEVFIAADQELGREVALKEIQKPHSDQPDSRSRFVLEAEITGSLEHPGIVPVYSLGHYADGRPFYAMRFIKGDSLKEAIEAFHKDFGTDPASRDLGLRKLLRRFYDVCNALEYAHSRGILHRDLKPGNVMLGKYGETLVVDWGLAKPVGRRDADTSEVSEATLRPTLGSGATPTQAGSVLGTPAYMSPEQAGGRLEQLGPASDVYSLGATLYCLLTGQAPFTGSDAVDTLAQVRQGSFPRPRQIRPDIPRALEAVCLKAMALVPDKRYSSVAELGKDIERWLDDQPVSAWPEPWSIKARRFLKRHRTLVTTSAAVVLVALVSLVVITLLLNAANEGLQIALGRATQAEAVARDNAAKTLEQKNQAETEKARANLERDRALKNEFAARQNLYLAQVNQAHLAWQTGQVGRVLDLLDATMPDKTGGHDFRAFEWYYLRRLCSAAKQTFQHDHPVMTFAFDDETKTLASVINNISQARKAKNGSQFNVSRDLILWDSKMPHRTRSFPKEYVRVAFSPNGKVLAAGDKVWEVATGKEVCTLPVQGFGAVAFHPDGQRLAVPFDKTLKVCNALTGAEEGVAFQSHDMPLNCLEFSADGELVLGGSFSQPAFFFQTKTIVVWNAKSGKQIKTFTHPQGVLQLAVSASGDWIASVGHDFTVRIWDFAKGTEKHVLRQFYGVNHAAFSPDGKYLVTGSVDPVIRVWDVATGQEVRVIRGHFAPVSRIMFSRDGKQLLSSSDDGTVRVWEFAQEQEYRSIRESASVECLAFLPDGKHLAAGTAGVTLWDIESGKASRTIRTTLLVKLTTPCIAISRDGNYLALPGMTRFYPTPLFDVQVWEPKTGKRTTSIKRDYPLVTWLAFDPSGDHLAIPQTLLSDKGGDHLILVDVATGKEVRRFSGYGMIFTCAFSPDGDRLTFAAADRLVRIAEVKSGREIHKLAGHTVPVLKIAFLEKGKQLISVSKQEAIIWDASTGKEIRRFNIESSRASLFNALGKLDVSPDGKRLAVVGTDGTVKLWDVATGQETLSLKGPPMLTTCVAFSPDGKRLAAGSLDGNQGNVRIWNGSP